MTAVSVVFESGPVRPLALTPDGGRLLFTNTPDHRLEILRVSDAGISSEASVRVGLEPVAVAARSDHEVWVVNHLSDSVSIVDLRGPAPAVVRTLLVGDEPQDVVFAAGRAFVTTARRGQNSPSDPALTTPGVGRAEVWVFDADNPGRAPGGEPLAILRLFGDSPRAMSVSPDGTRVYAAVFKSGNRTTSVSAFAVCPGGDDAPPCLVEDRWMPGGLPPPTTNVEGISQPRTGLIVRHMPESDVWADELGRDWGNAVDIELPDFDVFEIEATANPPREVRAFSGVGTVLYNLAVHPTSGHIFVSNTEANNEVRFEPRVRGRQHLSRISILSDEGVAARHLNKHIDYTVVPSPPGTADRSLALPQGMAFSADGSMLYVAAFGSGAVGVFDVAALEADSFVPGTPSPIRVSGGGPAGIIVDARRGRLYVATRFDNGVKVIDPGAGNETGGIVFHSPESPDVVRGRRWLYDARATSSNGEATCAGCHVFGDTDDLAWDLGDPNAPVVSNPNPVHEFVLETDLLGTFWYDFHPMKGPLMTQSLRGIATHGPMHWRGDRSGAFLPDGRADDTREAFRQFGPAFVSLLGAAQPPAADALEDLTTFALALRPGPNPHRPLDNRLTPEQEEARRRFHARSPEGNGCIACHEIAPEAGRFGTATTMSSNFEAAQLLKIPSLRGVYRKVGMFGLFPRLLRFDEGATGPQIRGFGFIHDGSLGVFVGEAVAYVMAIEADFAPIVGQQLTLAPPPGEGWPERLTLLHERCSAAECDLVASAVVGGHERGWLVRNGELTADRVDDPKLDIEGLLRIATESGVAVTFTAFPPETGERYALDRDGDGDRDGDEIGAGTNPADGADFAIRCAGDCNRDGSVTVEEIVTGVQLALGAVPVDACLPFDANRDRALTVDELVQGVNHALRGCPA